MLTTQSPEVVHESIETSESVDQQVHLHFDSLEAPKSKVKSARLSKALSVEWLGQTIASLCWITSVFCYGISSIGDGLQLAAASAWLIANIAVIVAQSEES